MPGLSPMLEQYRRIKAEHPDKILFFRMGDFYEMFFQDAVTASRILEIVLTSRDKDKEGGVPMCGVPHHAAEQYIARLLSQGLSVAICEQVEDPRQARGLVKREVIKVITPGTALSHLNLSPEVNNYLMALSQEGKKLGLAGCDLSTGEFFLTELDGLEAAREELSRLAPREILVSQAVVDAKEWQRLWQGREGISVQGQPAWLFDYASLHELLLHHFKVKSLDGFGCAPYRAGIIAAGLLLRYLKETQKEELAHITKLTPYRQSDFLSMDESTRMHLELFSSLYRGGRQGSLLGLLDRTVTALGARKLKRWLTFPLVEIAEINRRLDTVVELQANQGLRRSLREDLKQVADLERLASRLALGNATPRDLVVLKNSLGLIPQIRKRLKQNQAPLLEEVRDGLGDFSSLNALIGRALSDNPPSSLKEGGIIRPGYHPDLDELRSIRAQGKDWMAQLERKERERTGIPTLRVKYNNIFSYFIEVTKSYLEAVPQDYVRRQTLVNAERFITAELKDYESKVLGAEERIYTLEQSLFNEVRQEAASYCREIAASADALAILDGLCSLAEVAHHCNYVRPVLNDGSIISIKEGRHPVVEALAVGERFVPNDTYLDLDDHRLLIITGPNMAGKSTYVRQVALIVLMAQMGSLVPAREATIGVVDQIFARIGASDNLAQGQSTFMVEMSETANILNNATKRSLIILDEIGRGTSTYDGVSIAWSVAEFISDPQRLGAKTLFATHYHELTELALTRPGIKNYNVAVKEWNEEIIFLRKILEGGSDRSYGIQVARLAGLPQEVVARAREVLARLEREGQAPRSDVTPSGEEQLALFTAPADLLRLELEGLEIDRLTPLEALIKLKQLKETYA